MADDATEENEASSTLRQRKEKRFNYSGEDSKEGRDEANPPVETRVACKNHPRSLKQFFRQEWDSLAWIVAASILTYVTDFWLVLLQGPMVARFWLYAGVGMYAAASVVMGTLFYRCPNLHYTNWKEEAPVGVATTTVLIMLASISVTSSLWPVWSGFTLPILFVLFMALVSLLSLFS